MRLLFRRRRTEAEPVELNYVPDPHNDPLSPDFIEHLDGLDWFNAPPPPRKHECWVQTRGFSLGECVARCACGAISLDRPYELKYHPRYWMERNQRNA